MSTVAKVFEANMYSLGGADLETSTIHSDLLSPSPPSPPSPPSSSSPSSPASNNVRQRSESDSVPFKVLVTGKTAVVSLLSSGPPPSPSPAQLCSQFGMVAPLLICLLYNPFLSLQSGSDSSSGGGGGGGGGWRGEASLYNLTVGHNREQSLVSE